MNIIKLNPIQHELLRPSTLRWPKDLLPGSEVGKLSQAEGPGSPRQGIPWEPQDPRQRLGTLGRRVTKNPLSGKRPPVWSSRLPVLRRSAWETWAELQLPGGNARQGRRFTRQKHRFSRQKSQCVFCVASFWKISVCGGHGFLSQTGNRAVERASAGKFQIVRRESSKMTVPRPLELTFPKTEMLQRSFGNLKFAKGKQSKPDWDK